MKNALTVIFFIVLFVLGETAYKVHAQGSGGALVVATCGTLPLAFTPGTTRQLTVNINGQVCQ